jgi:Tfp pilus assembly protein PilF
MVEPRKEETNPRDRICNYSPSRLFFVSTSVVLIALAFIAAAPHTHAQKKRKPVPKTGKAATGKAAPVAASKAGPRVVSAKSIVVKSEPRAVVWFDEVRRGVTDETGGFEITKVSPGRHTLRVRAAGFAERTLSLLPTERGVVQVALTPTTDEAELAFQRAEAARERASTDEARREAAELYRRALTLRPRFSAARIGLARVLLDLNDYDGALDEVEEARGARRAYAEASVVEGRILRATSQNEEAVEAYERAIREARGFQPEAHTGLGIIYEEQGKYEEAAAAFRKAIAQLSDTEPVLYELIGRTYERLEKYKEAVAAYEKYLQLAPNGKLAPAIESVIEQLRKQAAEQDAPPN